MSGPKVGDRVRVVMEGDVKESGVDLASPWFFIGDDFATRNTIFTDSPHIVSVEVIAKPLKVGDTIEGDQYETARLGTVITDEMRMGYFRTSGGWVDLHGTRISSVARTATVVYVPEATS